MAGRQTTINLGHIGNKRIENTKSLCDDKYMRCSMTFVLAGIMMVKD